MSQQPPSAAEHSHAHSHAHPPVPAEDDGRPVDPVCGMKVDPQAPKGGLGVQLSSHTRGPRDAHRPPQAREGGHGSGRGNAPPQREAAGSCTAPFTPADGAESILLHVVTRASVTLRTDPEPVPPNAQGGSTGDRRDYLFLG